ncbi:FGGY-family carbohydrate kinase [Nonomuraea sp. NN258]|uniref:FGGY-family carbohydrate kinase n=1 Tax=Nonomuraea antri TaxID=2730852 RepID=UPI001568621B|nr:FGGY-family carbohydrate kinase [Nonomuraea antri]NRQ30267.1 FGGY-family carbohydrate kinase [Nonomuraea antri]
MFLGIDIGTSSSKGVLVAPDGTVAATAVREHDTATPRPGWFEHDAEAVWWADFLSLIAELARPDVTAVGLSGIGPCVLPCTADGEPLRPAILYGVDTRATAEIAAQADRYGKDAIMDRCGTPLTSQAAGPKLEWLRVNEPEVWGRTKRLFMAHSWLAYRLTGAYVLDHHSASQCTPLYDTRTHEWIGEWAHDIAPGLELPALAWSGDVIGEVTAAAAAATGLPAGIPVVAGTIDAWAEATSVGVDSPGDVMLMYGTTMFLVEVLDSRGASPHLWGTVGVAPGTYNLAAGMATSGAVTAWLRDLTGASFADLTAEAGLAGRGAEGLLMLPYFAGERTPLFDPDARGTLIGLTLRHGRGHLYRAALEATAFGVRHNLEAMREAGGTAKRLVAVGGGTRGGLWTQIVSDVLQQPQVLPTHTVGAAFGDAMLAARALGVETGGWNPPASLVEPDPGAAADYDRLYTLYRDLYTSTSGIAHALAVFPGLTT